MIKFIDIGYQIGYSNKEENQREFAFFDTCRDRFLGEYDNVFVSVRDFLENGCPLDEERKQRCLRLIPKDFFKE